MAFCLWERSFSAFPVCFHFKIHLSGVGLAETNRHLALVWEGIEAMPCTEMPICVCGYVVLTRQSPLPWNEELSWKMNTISTSIIFIFYCDNGIQSRVAFPRESYPNFLHSIVHLWHWMQPRMQFFSWTVSTAVARCAAWLAAELGSKALNLSQAQSGWALSSLLRGRYLQA